MGEETAFQDNLGEKQDQFSIPDVPPARSNRAGLWWGLGIGCVVLLLCVLVLGAGAWWAYSHMDELFPDPLGEIVVPEPYDYPMPDGNALGDPNAPVRIDAYSDFQCIYCKRYSDQTERQLIEEYVATGKVYYVFHTAGSWLGSESGAAAEALYCAGDQGAFWSYHDILMANMPPEENGGYLSRTRLQKMARLLGLNMDQFTACLDNHQFAIKVQQDADEVASRGLQGVPAFIFNDGAEMIDGAYPFSEFKAKIDSLLFP